uniref:Uncharacterized protein n=1 Tax=Anguilla anguilla TaxID=7936 RepID=A0A0E9TZA5_ANGAN
MPSLPTLLISQLIILIIMECHLICPSQNLSLTPEGHHLTSSHYNVCIVIKICTSYP